MSKKRARENREHAKIRALVFERDRGCLLAGIDGGGYCVGILTPHHILKASHGGPFSLLNLVALCGRHNGDVEDAPEWAHSLGLVCRNGDTLDGCWERMAAAGLVDYGPDGTLLAQSEPELYSALDT